MRRGVVVVGVAAVVWVLGVSVALAGPPPEETTTTLEATTTSTTEATTTTVPATTAPVTPTTMAEGSRPWAEVGSVDRLRREVAALGTVLVFGAGLACGLLVVR